MKPQPGDLLFFHNRTVGGFWIRLFQSIQLAKRSRFSHVAVVLSGGLLHDVLDPVTVHQWEDYAGPLRDGSISITIYRPTMGEHSAALESDILWKYPHGMRYGWRKVFLGLIPDKRPICSEVARHYLEMRAGRTMPAIDWKRRDAGERRNGGGWISVDSLIEAREKDGTRWLAYCGELLLADCW